jgi:nicotinamidase/pyrazinamidase
MKTALLLIDIQHDFLTGSLAVPDAEAILPEVITLMDVFRARCPGPSAPIIASQDWHPEQHGSFADVHGVAPFSMVDLDGVPQMAWPRHCVAGTTGADMPDDIRARVDQVVRKGTNPRIDSYSAFADNADRHGRRMSTILDDMLVGMGVTHLVVAGLATDYCVKATVIDARAHGYEVTVVSEACRGVNPGTTAEAIAAMHRCGARVVRSVHEVF